MQLGRDLTDFSYSRMLDLMNRCVINNVLKNALLHLVLLKFYLIYVVYIRLDIRHSSFNCQPGVAWRALCRLITPFDNSDEIRKVTIKKITS